MVVGGDHFGRLAVSPVRGAVLAGDQAGSPGHLLILFQHLGGVEPRPFPLVPADLKRIASLFCRPEAGRDHRHPARHLHDLFHPGDGLCLGGVEAPDLAAEHRGAGHHRGQKTGEPGVEPELRGAVHLGGGVEAELRRAEQPVPAQLLEPDLLRDRHSRGQGGQLAKGERLSLASDDPAVFGPAAGRLHPPFSGRGGDQHLPGGGARLRQAVPFAPDTAAPPCHHDGAECRVVVSRGHWRRLDADFAPIALQFLGDQHGERGIDPLAHFRLVDDEGHRAVTTHAEEGVRRKGRLRRFRGLVAKGEIEPEYESAADEGAGFEKIAAAQVGDLAHLVPPFPAVPAAVWMARRMRW